MQCGIFSIGFTITPSAAELLFHAWFIFSSWVPPRSLDSLLCQPKDILKRIGLPPPVDLDALLADATKPVIFAKDILDSRGKQISHRASLVYADANACHSKWVKIENTVALFAGRTDFLAEFDSLNYDPKLVPVKSMKYLPSTNYAAPSAYVSFPFIDFGSSLYATCSRASSLSPSEILTSYHFYFEIVSFFGFQCGFVCHPEKVPPSLSVWSRVNVDIIFGLYVQNMVAVWSVKKMLGILQEQWLLLRHYATLNIFWSKSNIKIWSGKLNFWTRQSRLVRWKWKIN